MANTATTRDGLMKQSLGSNLNTWGDPNLNNSVFDLVDEAMDGYELVTLTGSTLTLTSTTFSSNQARNRVIEFTSSGGLSADTTVYFPAVEKNYLLVNSTTGSYTLTVQISSNSGVTLKQGAPTYVYFDGTSGRSGSQRLDQVALPQSGVDMNVQRITNLNTPSTSADAATKGYVDAIGYPRLDQCGAPTAAVSFNNQRITTLASGINPQDGVSVQQVNALIAASLTASTAAATVRVTGSDTSAGFLISKITNGDGMGTPTVSAAASYEIFVLPVSTGTRTARRLALFNLA